MGTYLQIRFRRKLRTSTWWELLQRRELDKRKGGMEQANKGVGLLAETRIGASFQWGKHCSKAMCHCEDVWSFFATKQGKDPLDKDFP